MKKLVSVLVAFLGLAGLGAPALSQTVDLAPYFNMTVGKRMTYWEVMCSNSSCNHMGAFVQDTLALTEEIGAIHSYYWPESYVHFLQCFKEGIDGNYLIGSYYMDTHQSYFEDYFPPPGPIDGVTNVGETREYDVGVYIEGEQSMSYSEEQALIAAHFPCSSLAGVFDDCVLLRSNIHIERSGDEYDLLLFQVWARSVGPIFFLGDDGTNVTISMLVSSQN